MVLEVEIRKNAATSPHINAVAEGQAEEYFWRPEEGRREGEKSAGEFDVFTKNDVKQQKTFRVKAPAWNWLHVHPWSGFSVIKGKPKVDQFHLEVTLANKHDVVWFDVGMQDAEIGEGIHSTEELRQDRTTLVRPES